MDLTTALLTGHLVATVYMAGLIWFVQLVHYPLMKGVGPERFALYANEHSRRTGWAVGAPMLVEGATAAMLALSPRTDPALAWPGLGLLVLIWLSTAFLQVPCHRALGKSFDEAAIARLVRTNWIRTTAWTMRAGLAVAMFRTASL